MILFLVLLSTVLGAYVTIWLNLPKQDLLVLVSGLYFCGTLYFTLVSPNRHTAASRVTSIFFMGATVIFSLNIAEVYFPGHGGHFLDLFSIVAAGVLMVFTTAHIVNDNGDIRQWKEQFRTGRQDRGREED